jgi:hypothetical protein
MVGSKPAIRAAINPAAPTRRLHKPRDCPAAGCITFSTAPVPDSKADTTTCREFFHDMRLRWLPDPLPVVSDEAPGMIRAIEGCLPRSACQRCLAHKVRNLQSKVPEYLSPEFKARVVDYYQAASPARQSRIPIRRALVGYLRHKRSRAQHPRASLSPLQQGVHIGDRVGIAFQAVHILFGLQFNLQSDAVRIMEVEGLAIPPFDNFGHGDPMVLEPLVSAVKFLRRVHR